MKAKSIGVVVALMVLIVVGWLVWPQSGRPADYTVRIPLPADIQTLDPAALSDPTTARMLWQVYEGLVGLDANNSIVPLIAESWESQDDGRRWVFQIRDDVYFHPHPVFGGERQTRAVVAKDVVWSWTKIGLGFGSFVFAGLVEGFNEFIQGEAAEIAGIQATGEREVTISLTRPDQSFIHRVSTQYLAVMPREVMEAEPDAFGRTVAIGTGPFRLVRASATEIELARNEGYWRSTGGNVERLVFRVEKNPQFRVTGLNSGHYDLVQVPLELRSEFFEGDTLQPRLQQQFNAAVHGTFNVHYLGIDAAQVQDAALRRALSLAVDREAVARTLLSGGAVPARGPVPPDMQAYVPPLDYGRDAAEARRALSGSSYDGEELDILVSDAANHADVAQVVQGNLADTGIRTRIDLVDFNTLVSRLFSDDRPPLFLAYSEWVFSAPELIMGQFRSTATPNPNLFGYADKRVDALLDEIARTDDRTSINTLCAEVEKIVGESPPAAWLYSERHSFVMDRRLSSLAITGNNHWLLEELRVD